MCLALIIGLIPKQLSQAADALPSWVPNQITYDTITTPYALFNSYNNGGVDTSFYTTMSKLGANSPFNVVSKFKDAKANYLLPNTQYVKNTDVYEWSDFLTGAGNHAYSELANSGQLQMGASAAFTNVNHTLKADLGLKTATSTVYQWLSLSSGYDTPLTLSGESFLSAGTGTQTLGIGKYQPITGPDEPLFNSLTLQTGLGRNFAPDTKLADAKIANIIVSFADLTAPTVTGVAAYDSNNVNPVTFAKPGDIINLHVNFSEPIRFSDDSAAHNPSDLTATVSGGGTDSGYQTAAYLTGLIDDTASDNNYLNFEFQVPDGANDTTADHLLNTIDLSKFFGNNKLNLVYGSNQTVELNKYAGGGDGTGFTKSPSLITDLAGNPLSSASGTGISMPAFNIDVKSPHVTAISKTANMNNDDVKADLGKTNPSSTDYYDASDTTAGVGDTITYTAAFNEELSIDHNSIYSSNYYIGFNATLNVTYNDQPVTLQSRSMTQVGGGSNAPLNGPSNGKYTEVSFQPFTVQSGMTVNDPDGSIRIVSITPASSIASVTDIAGRDYTDTDCTAANTNPYALEAAPPTVGTTFQANLDGTYTPRQSQADNSYTVSFPVTVSDASGTNGLLGSFSWQNHTNGANFDFEYAVLPGDNTPENSTTWLPGTMGLHNYTFTQVSGGSTIYLKLPLSDSKSDPIPYDISNTKLTVTAENYAGNKVSRDFGLNYTLDKKAPAVQLKGVAKARNSDDTGTLTATVIAADNASQPTVFYQWGREGTSPDPNGSGWNNAQNVPNTDPNNVYTVGNSVAVYAVKNVNNSGDSNPELYVKAQDSAGNVLVSDLGSHQYDLSPTKYDANYTDGLTQKASLAISGLDSGHAVAVMIQDPDDSSKYFVSVVDGSGSHYGDVMGIRFPTQDGSDAYPWCEYTVTQTGEAYNFTYVTNLNNYSDSGINRLRSILLGRYYGTLNVTLLSGMNSYSDTDGSSSAFSYATGTDSVTDNTICELTKAYMSGTYTVTAEDLTLKAAGNVDSFDTAGEFKNVSLSLIKPDSSSTLLTSTSFDPGSTTHALSTLAGLQASISGLANALVPSFGFDDIDFANSYIDILQTNDKSGASVSNSFGRVYLSPQDAQTVTIPAAEYTSGRYFLELHLAAKTSGQCRDICSQEIDVDATPSSSDFGLAEVYYKTDKTFYSNYEVNDPVSIYYGPIYGSEASDKNGKPLTQYASGSGTIVVPADSDTMMLYFTSADTDIGYNGCGLRAIRAWNATDGVTAADSQANAKWLQIAYPYNDSNTPNLDFYNAQIVSDASGVLLSAKDGNLPLIRDKINVIDYQVKNANGLLSEVRTAAIYPVSARGTGTVSSDPAGAAVQESGNGMPDSVRLVKGGNLVFTPSAPTPGLTVSVWDWDSRAGQPYALKQMTPDGTSYTYPLSPGLHRYTVYTKDSYGNYKFFAPAWSYVDIGAPTVTSNLIQTGSVSDSTYTANVSFKEESVDKGMAQTLLLSLADNSDAPYYNSLNLTSSDNMRIPLAMKRGVGTYTAWQAAASNQFGIYRVDVSIQQDSLSYGSFYDIADITIYGAVKYDGTDSGRQVGFTLEASLEDPFGSISAVSSAPVTATVKNPAPGYNAADLSFIRRTLTDSGPTFQFIRYKFDTPVMLEPSLGAVNPSPYSELKTNDLPLFGGSENTTVKYKDIFGTEYKENINDGGTYNLGNNNDAGIGATLSAEGWTKGPETLTLTGWSQDSAFEVFDVTNSTDPATDTSKPLTVDANGKACFVASTDPGNYVLPKASLTFSANAQLRVDVNDGTGTIWHEYMYVTNIVSGTPPVTMNYYFSDSGAVYTDSTLPSGDITTSGNVTVTYTSSDGRTLVPVLGSSASHTFTYGGPSSYTFVYTDQAGNQGSATVDLTDLKITFTQSAARDKSFDVSVFAKTSGVYGAAGDFSSNDANDSNDNSIVQGESNSIVSGTGYIQSLYYAITTSDDYRITLLSGDGTSKTPFESDYVKVSGDTIEITGGKDAFKDGNPGEFTVVLTDSADNTAHFTLNTWDWIDNTPPTGTYTISRTAFNSPSTATINTPSDRNDEGNVTGNGTILAPAEAQTGSYTFRQNETLNVTLTDAAGNITLLPVTENELDMSAAKATVSWNPCYVDSTGKQESSAPPATVTNSDVRASVSYDRLIKEVYIYLPTTDASGKIKTDSNGNIIWPATYTFNSINNGQCGELVKDGSGAYSWSDSVPQGDTDILTFNYSSQLATVVFHQGGVPIKLAAVSLNQKETDTELILGSVIDKTPLTVTAGSVSYHSADGYTVPTSASFQLTPSKDSYCPGLVGAEITGGGGQTVRPSETTLYKANTAYTVTVIQNGTYSYVFTDAGGNVATARVSVTTPFDTTPPKITLVRQLGANNSVTVTISSDEASAISVARRDGTSLSIIASGNVQSGGSLSPVIITQNGTYFVSAVDNAGNTATSAFTVGTIDNTPPSIWFSPTTVAIRQGSSSSALDSLLGSGINVSDDVSAADKITVTNDADQAVNGHPTVNLSQTGTYTVTYTATDEAGNPATGIRFVVVYPQNELDVSINGKRVEIGGTAVLSSRTVTFSLNDPVGNEPYTVYLRSGIRSEGQMKYGALVWTPDSSGNYTLPGNGFYTVYLITQSRETYIVTLYVQ